MAADTYLRLNAAKTPIGTVADNGSSPALTADDLRLLLDGKTDTGVALENGDSCKLKVAFDELVRTDGETAAVCCDEEDTDNYEIKSSNDGGLTFDTLTLERDITAFGSSAAASDYFFMYGSITYGAVWTHATSLLNAVPNGCLIRSVTMRVWTQDDTSTWKLLALHDDGLYRRYDQASGSVHISDTNEWVETTFTCSPPLVKTEGMFLAYFAQGDNWSPECRCESINGTSGGRGKRGWLYVGAGGVTGDTLLSDWRDDGVEEGAIARSWGDAYAPECTADLPGDANQTLVTFLADRDAGVTDVGVYMPKNEEDGAWFEQQDVQIDAVTLPGAVIGGGRGTARRGAGAQQLGV